MANHVRPKYKVDLARLHALWSANYAALVRLVPTLRDGESRSFTLTALAQVDMMVVDRGPYTVVLDIRQHALAADAAAAGGAGDEVSLPDPCACHFRLRVYHDARMAEVIASEGHRYLKPRYDYPNPGMYQRDEKYQVNCLFSEWLKSCFVQQGAAQWAAMGAPLDVRRAPESDWSAPSKIVPRE